ncbi:MAG: tRNA-binding protein [Candidatus Aenigmarchaeota archaeon]|nr:tRNA-binding protein [Candidatus Aenigmarchaeota archaeon]
MVSVTIEDFQKIDIRVGKIVSAEKHEKSTKSAYKLKIDFGLLGIKQSSAQITKLYKPEELVGKQILAVVNFPAKEIAGFSSEVLVMGIYSDKGVVLLKPEKEAKIGERVG